MKTSRIRQRTQRQDEPVEWFYRSWPERSSKTFLASVPDRETPKFRKLFARFLTGTSDKKLRSGIPPFRDLIRSMDELVRADILKALSRLPVWDQLQRLNGMLRSMDPEMLPIKRLRALNRHMSASTEEREQAGRLGYAESTAPSQVAPAWVEEVYMRCFPPLAIKEYEKLKFRARGQKLLENLQQRYPLLRGSSSSFAILVEHLLWATATATPEEAKQIQALRAGWAARLEHAHGDVRELKKVRDQIARRSLIPLMARIRKQDRRRWKELLLGLLGAQTAFYLHQHRFASLTELSKEMPGLVAELKDADPDRKSLIAWFAPSSAGGEPCGSEGLLKHLSILCARSAEGLISFLGGFLDLQAALLKDPHHQLLSQMLPAWTEISRKLKSGEATYSYEQLCDFALAWGPGGLSAPSAKRSLQRLGLKLRNR